MSSTNNCESLRSRRFIHLHERIAPLWGNPTLWRMPVGEGRRLAPVCEVAPGTNPGFFATRRVVRSSPCQSCASATASSLSLAEATCNATTVRRAGGNGFSSPRSYVSIPALAAIERDCRAGQLVQYGCAGRGKAVTAALSISRAPGIAVPYRGRRHAKLYLPV